MRAFDQPVAITKHPRGTGTFLIRLCTDDGTRYQNHLVEPKSITEMLATLDEQAALVRNNFCKGASDQRVVAAPRAEDDLQQRLRDFLVSGGLWNADAMGSQRITDLIRDALEAIEAIEKRVTAAEQELAKGITEARKYVSPQNANTELRPLIRDIAQAKITAMDNYKEVLAAFTRLRGQIETLPNIQHGSPAPNYFEATPLIRRSDVLDLLAEKS